MQLPYINVIDIPETRLIREGFCWPLRLFLLHALPIGDHGNQ